MGRRKKNTEPTLDEKFSIKLFSGDDTSIMTKYNGDIILDAYAKGDLDTGRKYLYRSMYVIISQICRSRGYALQGHCIMDDAINEVFLKIDEKLINKVDHARPNKQKQMYMMYAGFLALKIYIANNYMGTHELPQGQVFDGAIKNHTRTDIPYGEIAIEMSNIVNEGGDTIDKSFKEFISDMEVDYMTNIVYECCETSLHRDIADLRILADNPMTYKRLSEVLHKSPLSIKKSENILLEKVLEKLL